MAMTPRVGIPPGRYLTRVRVEAAQRLLLHREYTLDVVASLCGFSGANYLCRVFKKETGQSPAPVSYTHLDVYKRQMVEN